MTIPEWVRVCNAPLCTAPRPELQRTAESRRRLDDPLAVELDRRDAGQPAAAGGAVRAGGPAHHADHRQPAAVVLVDRAAGVAGAGAEPGLHVGGRRVDQAELQIAGL